MNDWLDEPLTNRHLISFLIGAAVTAFVYWLWTLLT